jgi:hypothetical protein
MNEHDLDPDEADREVVALFGPGSLIEEKPGGFIVWQASQPGAEGAPEGMSLASREIIGTGATRREAIESARRAKHGPPSP